MISYSSMPANELSELEKVLGAKYLELKAENNKLNMARGKPCKEQLMLSNGMLECMSEDDIFDSTGFDCRNYGGLEGLPEARALFAQLLETRPENVLVIGNSSLNIMYDTLARAMLFGMKNSPKPWSREDEVKFLCPSPGYDRHFSLTNDLGIKMITVKMTSHGPDMDEVERLAASDPSIKGIWCVPLYSNPDGITYSHETCKRLASMTTAAPDFTIMWDNSYFVHHLHEDRESVPDIIKLCESYNNNDRVYEFASTSKITWAGAGIACVASSLSNIAYVKSHMTFQTIGPDKINQLRHVRFLKDTAGVIDMMKKHEAILKPKFNKVLNILKHELGDCDCARWNVPKGGYFISLFVENGTAKEVVRLCSECGVELTPAGATYPYGIDPEDSNIRIAPSFPPINELAKAIEILCISVKLAAIRKAIAAK